MNSPSNAKKGDANGPATPERRIPDVPQGAEDDADFAQRVARYRHDREALKRIRAGTRAGRRSGL